MNMNGFTGFTEAVLELSQEEEFSAALNCIAGALRKTKPEDVEKDIEEIVCLLLKLEMAAYRSGYEGSSNKGRHPAMGLIKERVMSYPGLRVIQGGRVR